MKKRILILFVCVNLLFINICHAGVFVDIGDEHWAKEYIEYLSTKKIINGYGDGSFGPENSLTRAETVKIVLNSVKMEILDVETSDFSDISDEHSLLDYIETAKTKEIVSGYEDGTFLPNRPVTRAEFTKIFMVAAEKNMEEPPVYNEFDDVKIEDWYYNYVHSAYALNYLSGYSENQFGSWNNITRAEASKIIFNYLKGVPPRVQKTEADEIKLLELINNSREENGKEPLVLNDYLSKIARDHSQDLYEQYKYTNKDKWIVDHENQATPWTSHFSSSGKSFEERFEEAANFYEIDFVEAGENIGYASYKSFTIGDRLTAIHEAMMMETTNQGANILGTDIEYSEVGIGIVVSEDPKEIYITQVFISN